MASSVSGFETLTGTEWQSLCIRVLKEHYGPGVVVDIPDEDRGDGGIEAFTTTGHAFQCYAPENEPLSASELRKKHIRKLDSDCKKFVENREVIEKYITPGVLITRWMLLVPRIATKEVRNRCAELTTVVRNAKLPYVSPDVVITAVTLADYEGARIAVVTRQLELLSLPPIDEVSFVGLGDARSIVMDAKLAKTDRYQDQTRRDEIVDRFLKSHVSGKSHREFVSDQYSELSDSLESKLNDLERRLELQYSLIVAGNDNLLGTILSDTESLVKDTLNVSPGVARVIAEGQVAEWLMRCPLDFA